MTESPSFSVVVPTRHRAGSLRRCLDALAELDYPRERLEVVVAVDGTDDRLAPRVAAAGVDGLALTLVQIPRSGAGAARNAGAMRAGGQFVAFTDDDCVVDARWLAALAAVVGGDPGAVVGGPMVNRASANACSVASQVVLEATYAHHNPASGAPGFLATNNLAVPAEAFRRLGGFDEAFVRAEDREFCLRWRAQGGSTAWAPDAVVHHLRELDLRGLVRQHAGYGRGAYHLHRSRRTSPRLIPALEPGFYRHLAAGCRARRPGIGRLRLASLVIAAQAANALGFARELVRWRGGLPATPVPSPPDCPGAAVPVDHRS